jgi:hypothetical protein
MKETVKKHASKRRNRAETKLAEAANALTLTPRETVKFTRFGINRTYELLRTGQMPCFQIGKRFFVPKAALIKWLESAGGRPPLNAA